MDFKEIVEQRYAAKSFDGQSIPEDEVDELLELIRLSASSFGLQPWKVVVISDKETKEKLLPASWNQVQITSCSHLLVFCANTDIKSHIKQYNDMLGGKMLAYIKMMSDFESGMNEEKKLTWAQRQAYLAVGNAINGAKALGFDSCPMEGFSADEYSKILKLPKNLVPTALVTIGYANDKPHSKIRFEKEELFM